MIDSTGLKVFGEGEESQKKAWGMNAKIISGVSCISPLTVKHMKIICADLSLNNVTDSEAFPGLIRQTNEMRKIRAASADGAYDTRLCHDELRRKKKSARLSRPEKARVTGLVNMQTENRAVANQRLTGSNARWKWTNRLQPSLDSGKTAMYRVKQLFGGSLTLRDYDGQGK
ncbi:transposase [Klebsiella pneumoniae]|uniref:transposase n=1 Tax=Klebsiella pneumoniae TaxID=573 RepID=UPI001D192E96|nr:transposase [Klebsiella pneumoniae]